jgi:TRAP-type C4-dicarboxylate transport system substrate-binding protein
MTESITRRTALAGTAAFGAAAALPRPAQAQVTVLRWAENQASSHPAAQMIERAAKEVKEKSGGRIDLQGFPGGQLGGSRDVVEAVSSGAVTMTTEGAALLGQFVPQLSIIEAPYIWKDAAHMQRALASPLLEEMNKLLIERRGMRMIGVTYYGMRHLTTGAKAVRTVADMQGFKLRVPEVDTFRAMAEAWGARATPQLQRALPRAVPGGGRRPGEPAADNRLGQAQRGPEIPGADRAHHHAASGRGERARLAGRAGG